jgi:hypothetical protein
MVRGGGCTAGALEVQCCWFGVHASSTRTPHAFIRLFLLLLTCFSVKHAPRALACEHVAWCAAQVHCWCTRSAVLLVWCPCKILHRTCMCWLFLLLLTQSRRWFDVNCASRACGCEHAAWRVAGKGGTAGALEVQCCLFGVPRMLNLHPTCTLRLILFLWS